jgi:phytoene dehydrogenase-like protein
VLERRELLGGACVTEEVWPGQRVSRASLARVSPRDAAKMPEFDAMMERVADVLRP